MNDKNARRYFEALFHANFTPGDLCLHLTYRHETLPADEKEAGRHVQNFIARINRRRKKAGLDNVKYIKVTETGKNGRIHHHIVMEGGGVSRDEIERLWRLGYANADRMKGDPKDGLKAIVKYLMKDPKGTRRWNSSHNLVRPWKSTSTHTRISGKKLSSMKDLPEDSEEIRRVIEKDNPGYRLDSVEKSYREETGQWYFFCRMFLKEPAAPGDKPLDNVDNAAPPGRTKRKEQKHA